MKIHEKFSMKKMAGGSFEKMARYRHFVAKKSLVAPLHGGVNFLNAASRHLVACPLIAVSKYREK